MEPKKQPTSRASLLNKALAFCILSILPGSLLAAASGTNQITAGEIVMYVAIIVVVIGVAWFFASRQTDKLDKEHHEHMLHHPPKKHYDHPNDPHFRKLRKKTS
jgi:hypothetical protein